MKTKRFAILAVILGMAVSVFAQDVVESKYGADSANCVTKLSVYRELGENVCVLAKGAESDRGREENVTEEIADIITVCISYLNANGYDEKKRSELFAQVNEKNKKRGYFDERN